MRKMTELKFSVGDIVTTRDDIYKWAIGGSEGPKRYRVDGVRVLSDGDIRYDLRDMSGFSNSAFEHNVFKYDSGVKMIAIEMLQADCLKAATALTKQTPEIMAANLE